MRPVLRRGRHRDHRAAERNRHRHLLREHPGRRHRDGYRGHDRHEDDQKKARERRNERSLPVRASFPGSDADRRLLARHLAADEDHRNAHPVRLQDAGDVRLPGRHREWNALPRGHLGRRRDEACPGWMRRGCFRDEDRRDGVLRDEAHPAWLQSRRDAGREARPAWELRPAWGQRREYHVRGEHPA